MATGMISRAGGNAIDPLAALTGASNTSATPGGGVNQTNAFSSAIPGFSDLSSVASNNIKQLLAGIPSTDESRLNNAWYGAGSGLDVTSPFLINRGRGLYGAEAAANKQSGIDNFLKMLQGFSGTVVPTTGQEIQNAQFGQGQSQQESQFGRSLAQQSAAQDAQNAQFYASLGLDREKLSQQDKQYYDNLALQKTQTENQASQAAADLGLRTTQTANQADQYSRSLAQQQADQEQQNQQFLAQLGLNTTQVGNQNTQFNQSLDQSNNQFNLQTLLSLLRG